MKQYHWKGILIEPQPEIFRRLESNYADEPQLIFENVAISSQDGEATLYAFKKSDALPDHSTMLASFNKNVVVGNGHHYQGEIEELRVPALTLNTLLTKYHIAKIDLFQIDTEGFDFEIIKMLAETSVRPEIIHFESAFLNKARRYECDELLHSMGYRVLTVGVDSMAYRQADDDFAKVFANDGY